MDILCITGSQTHLLFFCQFSPNFQALPGTVSPQSRSTYIPIKQLRSQTGTTFHDTSYFLRCYFLVSKGHVLSVVTFKL